ncbi:hypothetical protein SI65_09675 [Aspergillus cristatus]|uniref:Actin-related protein 10 n=1 Tax=Aspergillus cristatus TaxID=573508 RepID=A0A1E3B1U6_ASPCR|nr:hypothetical protein SI65_09675 [Aspergillus cristatus]
MASISSISAADSKRFSGPHVPSNLRHSQTARPSSPSTPQHQLRSNNSSFASTSSGSSFRGEEDAIIFELGSRWLRAGFEGESTPMCTVGFGPEESRRTGDYRGWLNYGPSTDSERFASPEEWASAYELWGIDLRKVDLGLVEDKIERVVRETYNKYLLTDAGTTRLVLVLPSLMPHPLMASVLSTLFNRWRFPSITLLPAAAMSATAAGVRSALVVDLGWAETTVTGVYEYREVAHKRSTRAMKHLLQETGRFLTHLTSPSTRDPTTDELSVNFEYCEEVVTRFAWCKPYAQTEPTDLPNTTVSIPSPSNPGSEYIDIPFPKLAEPVEKALFALGIPECDLDDEEKPLPLLLYNTLLALPPDARGICMSRIIFVGGGSHIPGIRKRILHEVNALIRTHGWTQVRGKAVERQRTRLQNLSLTPNPNINTNTNNNSSSTGPSTGTTTPTQEPAATTSHTPSIDDEGDNEIDFVEQKLQRNRDRDFKPPVQGILREVESLGPWAGASLVTSLKIRGMVEIEREKYLQHGLAGASRDLEHGYVPDRRSGLRTGGDRSSWTLAGWG